MNTCSEVVFPNTEISIYFGGCYSRRDYFLFRKTFKALVSFCPYFCCNFVSQEFCSFILKIVASGLAKKLRKFNIGYYLNTETEFYVMNKVLWNMGTNFEDIVNSGKHFEKNQKLKKNFL
eukprot:snap_masked-scaffold_17-processed-gene-6.32-mRNA-1 protein AED:1.00 eAED:1.00 QI:0/0/0/0/1/1/2/0/119